MCVKLYYACLPTTIPFFCRLQAELDEPFAEVAERYFVAERQKNSKVTSEDFHRWIVLSRLICLSFGDAKIGTAHWHHMRKMEQKRSLREVVDVPNMNEKPQ